MKVNRLKVLAAVPRVTITALLLTCLLSTLVPGSAIASVLGITARKACCRGKSADHCHAHVKIKKRIVKSEVMCGLKAPAAEESTARDDDPPSTSELSDNQGLHVSSIANKCSADCGSCAVRSTEQQKRAVAVAVIGQTSQLTKRRGRLVSRLLAKARFEIEPFSARGPPVITTYSHII